MAVKDDVKTLREMASRYRLLSGEAGIDPSVKRDHIQIAEYLENLAARMEGGAKQDTI